MKAFKLALYRIVIISTMKILFIFFSLTGFNSSAQSLTSEFAAAGYTLTDLGSITNLPPQNGGLTIRPNEPNTLYIGGNANSSNAALYAVPLVRDPFTQHITGFGGPAILFVNTPNIDGGILFAPNGTLLFTRYSMNALGQILPDNTYVSTSLTQYGVNSSVGSLAIVPAGYPGAGNLIFSSYNASVLYHTPYTIDATGEYLLSNQTSEVSLNISASGPEGIAYIPSGSSAFPNLSMAISSYSRGVVVVFEAGPNGLPDVLTARDMVVGLTGAEGALIDPVTGDFLFSTFGGGNKVIRISGFEPPATYVISASAEPNGNIDPEGEVEVMEGADQLFLIAANPGYQIADVLVDGISVGAVNQYEFTNVVANHTIHTSLAAIAGPPDWTPVPNLQYNMQIVAKLQLAEGTFSVNENDIVAGFVGEECRGLVSPMALLGGMLFLTIGSNQQSGETVNFKAYLADQDLIVDLNESFEFVSMAEIGDFLNPFIFTFGDTDPPLLPQIAVTPDIIEFGDVSLDDCSILSYLLTATNLLDVINIAAPEGFLLSFEEDDGFETQKTAVPIAGSVNKTVYVRFCPSESQPYQGNVSNASQGAVTKMVEVMGNGVAAILPGDANCDGEVNILDAVTVINYILEFNPNPFCFENADASGDGTIDILDAVIIINIILNAEKKSVQSQPANIHLGDHTIKLESDGTLTALQFELFGKLNPSLQLQLLVDGFVLTTNVVGNKLIGAVFHPQNKALPSGMIDLISLEGGSGLVWGETFAGNINADKVAVNFLGDTKESFELSVYPNPSEGIFNLKFILQDQSDVVISLYDLAGKELYCSVKTGADSGVHERSISLDSRINPGIYLLKVLIMPLNQKDVIINLQKKIVIVK